MKTIGVHHVRHRLTTLCIERPSVFVELVTTGHDLVAIRQIFGSRRHFVVQAAIGCGGFLLQDAPPRERHYRCR